MSKKEQASSRVRNRVFLDTNICIDRASGKIPDDTWEAVRRHLVTDFEYCISPLTAQELLYSIENCNAKYFLGNRQRISALLSPTPVKFLEFPRQFMTRELHGLAHRVSGEIEAGFLNCFAVIRWVEHKSDLEEPVVLPHMTGEQGFQSSMSKARDIFVDLQSSYAHAMEAVRARGAHPLNSEAWASSILDYLGLESNPQSVQATLARFDAAYRFEACLYNLAKNPRYSFADRDTDLVDCQQLDYLSDPGMYFITHDARLRKWIEGSPQARRVLSLSEFLQHSDSQFGTRV